MRNEWHHFQAANLGIVAIGQGSAAKTKEFRAQLQLPFPMLADPRRSAYTAYSLLNMDLKRRASFAQLKHTVQATIAHGAAISRDQDMRQLGGVFVVGTDGVIRFAHRSAQVDDVPQPRQLIAVV
ncbi:MAG: redoxin domain-containing protein [Chloroflexi bacterium]|nr:redoxin domain-containing protein [Chloroflexota bacterium]